MEIITLAAALCVMSVAIALTIALYLLERKNVRQTERVEAASPSLSEVDAHLLQVSALLVEATTYLDRILSQAVFRKEIHGGKLRVSRREDGLILLEALGRGPEEDEQLSHTLALDPEMAHQLGHDLVRLTSTAPDEE